MGSNPWSADPAAAPTGLDVFLQKWKEVAPMALDDDDDDDVVSSPSLDMIQLMTDMTTAEETLSHILCDIDDLTFVATTAPLLATNAIDAKHAMLTALRAQMDAFHALRPTILQKLQTAYTSKMLHIAPGDQENTMTVLTTAETHLERILACCDALSHGQDRTFQPPTLDPAWTSTLAMYEQCYHAHARLRDLYARYEANTS
ncbi:hypothetical protein SDRG_13286 [Saprolegnia diclina VS20]|uniref:Uncharacterized protein n=1 Tax=Saprolegnia diclina (strain VS20) TaxID=1156394 RepID=T0PTY8_SAPDV|nr:hypothetical protein SDRG_13286 [Saprolegnia diclina VS20]EQC28949.1 hypothetical protein SDRG_13286 [Saprolegnia diclina VS20]|eukprot:XP_008617588.1 hypothetical protein SDRG_13286 [Saprolegnia diclina VS20]